MDLQHPSVDAFLSQPSSTIVAIALTPYNHSILHNLPTVAIPLNLGILGRTPPPFQEAL